MSGQGTETKYCIDCLLPFDLSDSSGEVLVERSEKYPNAYCERCLEDSEAEQAVIDVSF